MKISFLEVAEQELDEAINYFNDKVPALGYEFLGEVLKALDRLATTLMPGTRVLRERGAACCAVSHMV